VEPESKLSSLGTETPVALFYPSDHQKDVIGNRISSLVLETQGVQNQIAGLIATVSALDIESKSLRKLADAQKLVIDGLQNRYSGQEGAIDSLKNEVKGLKTANTGLRKDISALRDRIVVQDDTIESLVKQNVAINDAFRREKEQRSEDLNALRKVCFNYVAYAPASCPSLTWYQVIVLLTPLHLRVLLDRARGKILELGKYESWEDLRQNKTIFQLTQTVDALVANTPHCPSHDAIEFLCSYNNVRRQGNAAAHTASQEEIKEAVTTKKLETRERQCLEEIYAFIFDQNL
jgi:regulator of replication initiation timing